MPTFSEMSDASVLRLATWLSMRRRRVTEEHAAGSFMGSGPFHAAAIFARNECAQRACLR